MGKDFRRKTFLLLSVLCPELLHADVVPGRWEKVDALQPGFQIIVILKTGDRIESTFNNSGPQSVVLTDPSGSERTIPKSEVRKIVSGERSEDSVSDGTLVGLAVGLGAGFATGAAIYYGYGGEKPETAAPTILGVGALGAGIGTLVGYLMDKSHKGYEVLYQAPK